MKRTNKKISVEQKLRKMIQTEIKNILRESDDSGDEMSIKEMKKEIMDKIKKMKSNTNNWAVRDQLLDFTTWGFWDGDSMVSIDEKIARRILSKLSSFVRTATDGQIEEVYDQLFGS